MKIENRLEFCIVLNRQEVEMLNESLKSYFISVSSIHYLEEYPNQQQKVKFINELLNQLNKVLNP